MTEADEKRWLLTVNGAILEAVGRLTVHFTHLEEEVAQFLWSLVAGFDVIRAAPNAERSRDSFRAQKMGQAITVKLGFRQKTELLEALAFERFSNAPDLLESIRQIQRELESSATERNRLIHAVIAGLNLPDGSVVPGAAVALKSTRDEKLGMAQSISVHTQEQLAQTADAFSRLAYRVSMLRQRCFPSEET